MKTDWNNVASWYDTYLKGEDTYQAKVIAPNILRLINPQKGKRLLDVGSGQGYFSRLCALAGAEVVGIDQADELLAIAEKQKSNKETYIKGNAEDISALQLDPFDTVYSVLALENIRNIKAVIEGMAGVLKPHGNMIFVMLHPAFRIPQHSDWGFDAKKDSQYRKVYKYLSEISIPITLNPFKGGKEETVTFHRSIQWYMKIFKSSGFAISNIEEWISHKKSEAGKRQRAEDNGRKEFPLFLALELRKINN